MFPLSSLVVLTLVNLPLVRSAPSGAIDTTPQLPLVAPVTNVPTDSGPPTWRENTAPFSIASAEYVANVTSSNTLECRDLGYQGRVGNCYINTFGDTFGCQSTNPQENCNFNVNVRNSGGVALTSSSYRDVFVGSNGWVSQPFVPHFGAEQANWGLGITNVAPTGGNNGVIFFLASNGTNLYYGPAYFAGSGVATVTAAADCSSVTVSRTTTRMWYGNAGGLGGPDSRNETFYGDHGTMIGNDGLLYAYGQIPGVTYNWTGNSGIGVARVEPAKATNLAAYSYWNGVTWTKTRQYNPTVANVVFYAGQGAPIWNAHLNMYLYFTAYGVSAWSTVYMLYSPTPQGPWLQGPTVWTMDDMPYQYTVNAAQGHYTMFYTPTVLPKFSDPKGKYVSIQFTYFVDKASNDDKAGHQVITSVKVTFA